MQDNQHTVEVRPNEFEPIHDNLIDRCEGDVEMASFFHCLGKAISSDDYVVNSKYLKANLEETSASFDSEGEGY